jgi:hypothetical protein
VLNYFVFPGAQAPRKMIPLKAILFPGIEISSQRLENAKLQS